MIAVVQRVKEANVRVDGQVVGEIGNGSLVLVGIEEQDGDEDMDWLARKIVNLRIFNDDEGVMNRSVKEIGGEILVVSQFTLHASTKKGNRPSYIKAARPDIAIPIYESFKKRLIRELGKDIESGRFGAMMQVVLQNDGPVTLIIDTKNKV